MMSDDTLECFILNASDPNPQHLGYVVRHNAHTAVTTFGLGQLPAVEAFRDLIRDTIKKTLQIGTSAPTQADLHAFSSTLFNWLVQGEVQSVYDRLPNGHVRIQLCINHPEVEAVPWEYMHDPAVAGLQRTRTVVRVVPTIGQDALPPLNRTGQPLRILFVAAAPQRYGAVDWNNVRATLERTFRTYFESVGMNAGLAQITVIDGTTRTRFLSALQNNDFHILHFSGHGTVRNGIGHLALEDQDGNGDEISTADLMIMLNGRGLRLAVLTACETAQGNFAGPFSVIARELVRSGIPAVVASHLPLSNSTVASFVGTFYRQLLRSGDIDQAVTEARIRLAIDGLPLEWGAFTLYRHLLGFQAFTP